MFIMTFSVRTDVSYVGMSTRRDKSCTRTSWGWNRLQCHR